MATQRQIRSSRQVAVIINLRSRSGEAESRAAVKELTRHGMQVEMGLWVRSGGRLLEAVRAAISTGFRTVVIGGGDGTLSAVVDLFAERSDLTLGLLPLGTGNEVARILGIPLDLASACRVIAEGQTEMVDLAEANGDFFLHTALVGYPARANYTTPRWLKQRFGRIGYGYSLLASFLGSRPFHARVETVGSRWDGETALVVVGNSRFHLPGRTLLPSEAKRRGLLVYTPRDSNPSSLARLMIGLWGTHRPQRSLLLAACSDTVRVETDPPQDVDLDGELAGTTPVTFRLARDALRVLVPGRGVG